MTGIIKKHFEEHMDVVAKLNDDFFQKIEAISDIISSALRSNQSLFWCGNGGSCSDSLHLSAELIGRFDKNRIPLKSISLSSDVASITCIANDFGYDQIFSRQLEGLATKNDVLVVISTSGESENTINAAQMAKNKGVICIGFLGKNGGRLVDLCDHYLIVPSTSTARIQEIHIVAGHIICDLIESKLKLKD